MHLKRAKARIKTSDFLYSHVSYIISFFFHALMFPLVVMINHFMPIHIVDHYV